MMQLKITSIEVQKNFIYLSEKDFLAASHDSSILFAIRFKTFF